MPGLTIKAEINHLDEKAIKLIQKIKDASTIDEEYILFLEFNSLTAKIISLYKLYFPEGEE